MRLRVCKTGQRLSSIAISLIHGADFENMTVVKLKSLLREKGLVVSGNKSALIQRLTNNQSEPSVWESSRTEADAPQERSDASETMIEVKCIECNSKLRVPVRYTGNISCPSCSTKQNVADSMASVITIGYTTKKKGTATMVLGIFIGVFAIGMFLIQPFAAGCEQTLADQYLDTAFQDCLGRSLFMTSFASCCMILPLGFFISTLGYHMVRPNIQPVVGQASHTIQGAQNPEGMVDSNSVHTEQGVHALQPSNRSSLSKAVETTALGYGIGLATIATLLVLGFLLLIAIFIIVAFTW